MAQQRDDQHQTRQRLLEAGGEVFAERGYANATIRDICARAKANVAAVNYHFGDKEGLYAEVLRYSHRCAAEGYPEQDGVERSAPAGRRLAVFVRSFLMRMCDAGRPAWHGKLMSREMIEPTAALDALVSQEIRGSADVLEGIIRDLLGKRGSVVLVWRCACSVVAQCLFYHQNRAVITRLRAEQRFDKKEIEELAEHITAFSLAAIEGLKGRKGGWR